MSDSIFRMFEKSVFGKPSAESGEAGAGVGPAQPPGPIPLNQVQDPKWNARWRRFLNLTADVAARAFGPVPLPAVVLNLFGVESFFPEDQIGWFSASVAAGGAGNFSYVGLSNPAGSGILVIVTYISAFPTGAVSLGLATDVVGATGTQTTFSRDSRAAWTGGLTIPVSITDNTHAVANGGGAGPVGIKAAAGATSVVEWTGSGETGLAVISPGHNLAVVAQTAVIGVTAEFRFRTTRMPKN